MSDEEKCQRYLKNRWESLSEDSKTMMKAIDTDFIKLLWEKQFWQHLATQRKTDQPELIA